MLREDVWLDVGDGWRLCIVVVDFVWKMCDLS